jgi:putative ABC transport system permease protein
MALGTRAGDVRAMIVRDGLKLVALGVGLRFRGRRGCTLSSVLSGLQAIDPFTYGVGALLLFLAAALAAWLPARSASGVQPLVALRADG